MKNILTLLAFLVVSVNAIAQTPLDVNSPTGFSHNKQTTGNRGVVENGRFTICGYILYKYNGSWGWIDGSSTIESSPMMSADEAMQNYHWNGFDIFNGVDYYFSTQSKYSALSNNPTGNQSSIFYIKNCSGIVLYLFHNITTPGEFSITATPLDGSNNVLTTSQTLSAQGTYFPFLYGLDKTKSYKIELSVPYSTYIHEISFLERALRTYQTKVTDGVNWGTMYLDFPVTIPTDVHPNLQVFAVDAVVNNRCTISEIEDEIPAYTGVLLYEPNVPTHEIITFTETYNNESVYSLLSGTAETGFTIENAIQGRPSTTKVLTLGREKNSDLVGFFIYKDNDPNLVLTQYRAYLLHDYGTTSGGNVKGFYISGFDELTGIQTVESESTEIGNWYSLQGVRLNARPTQRGIYINNGKKVLVK